MKLFLADSIIVYRSRMEQNADEFWNEIFFPWVADHLLIICSIIFFISVLYWAINRKKRY